MKWEDLKVYRKLSKEELKPAFKHFTSIVALNLKPFGFVLHGRMLVRLLNDLFQVIHIDTRGSWSGISEYFKTEISLVAVTDKSPFVRGFDLTGRRRIEELAAGLRNYNQITQEYPLLADYLSRQVTESVLPYFNKYSNSGLVLNDRNFFKTNYSHDNLILFCELQNKMDIEARAIIIKNLSFYASITPAKSALHEFIDELELYKNRLEVDDWVSIQQKLEENKSEVLRKLKINPAVR